MIYKSKIKKLMDTKEAIKKLKFEKYKAIIFVEKIIKVV